MMVIISDKSPFIWFRIVVACLPATARGNGRDQTIKGWLVIASFIFTWLLGALVYEELIIGDHEEITYFQAVYYAAITFLTIGLGDYSVPWYGDDGNISVIVFITFTSYGLVCFATLLNLFGSKLAELSSSIQESTSNVSKRMSISSIENKSGANHPGSSAQGGPSGPSAAPVLSGVDTHAVACAANATIERTEMAVSKRWGKCRSVLRSLSSSPTQAATQTKQPAIES